MIYVEIVKERERESVHLRHDHCECEREIEAVGDSCIWAVKIVLSESSCKKNCVMF